MLVNRERSLWTLIIDVSCLRGHIKMIGARQSFAWSQQIRKCVLMLFVVVFCVFLRTVLFLEVGTMALGFHCVGNYDYEGIRQSKSLA